jgi:transcriptional regulator with XRE-family HTH domain
MLPGLRRERERRLMLQSELAEKTGYHVSVETISRLEMGRAARLSTARKLADALGVTVEDLSRN